MADIQIGTVTHYFDKIGVAVIAISKPIKVGDTIKFKSQTEFEQEVTSMQIEHESIQEAKAKEEVGMKVDQPVKKGDKVYKGK